MPFFRTPEQCPSVVSLLSESYNPHVRYGAAMALGICCAGTGNKVRTSSHRLFLQSPSTATFVQKCYARRSDFLHMHTPSQLEENSTSLHFLTVLGIKTLPACAEQIKWKTVFIRYCHILGILSLKLFLEFSYCQLLLNIKYIFSTPKSLFFGVDPVHITSEEDGGCKWWEKSKYFA